MKARLPQVWAAASRKLQQLAPGTEDAGADGADYHGARSEGIHRGRRRRCRFPTVTANGSKEYRHQAGGHRPDDAEMLGDLVAAAVNEALRAAANEKEEAGAISGGMSLPGIL